METGRGKRVAIHVATLAVVVLGVAAWLSWPQLRFWWLFEPLGKNAQGLLEYRHRRTGMVMVRVPGGTFWMGAQSEDPKGHNYDPEAWEEEEPVHEVALSPFLIAKYEVTQAQWTAVLGSNPSHFRGDDGVLPVEGISWEDAGRFAARTGLSIPTEAQWEYACRARTDTSFSGRADAIAWCGELPIYGGRTHPVGTKAPNGFGIHDTHGNVWECCADIYDTRFYRRPEARGPDPVATSGSEFHVIRGGCWAVGDRGCRSSRRSRFHGFDPGEGPGLRVAFYRLP